MKTSIALLLVSSVLGLRSSVGAQGAKHHVTFLVGTQPDQQSVRVFDEQAPAGGSNALLSGMALLPFDKTQRTALSSLDPSRARRVVRRGVVSVELPDGGRLYHYRRAGRSVFGYLHVPVVGAPVVLVERSGVGGGGTSNPFEEKVGVASDGRHAAFATTAGEFLLARLDGRRFASSGSATRRVVRSTAVPIEVDSLSPGAVCAFFVTDDDRIWRVDYSDGALPVDCTPQATGSERMDDELAMSGDGQSVVFLFGPRRLESLYQLRSVGNALRLPPPPADYEEAGYLPETAGGPFLLLNADGTRLMYVDSTVREEVYLLDTTTVAPTTHVTSDPNFLPYIGVVILPSFSADTLLTGVGDPGRIDWFTATTSRSQVTNLTLTGANAVAPFDAGSLSPLAGMRAGDGCVVSMEMQAGTALTRLRAVHPRTGSLWTSTRTLRGGLAIGSGYGIAPSLLVPAVEGDVLVDAGDGSLLLAAPPGIELSSEIESPDRSIRLFIASVRGAGSSAVVMRRSGGLRTLLVRQGLRQIALTSGGGLVLNDGQLTYFGPAANTVVLSATDAVVLSGPSN